MRHFETYFMEKCIGLNQVKDQGGLLGKEKVFVKVAMKKVLIVLHKLGNYVCNRWTATH